MCRKRGVNGNKRFSDDCITSSELYFFFFLLSPKRCGHEITMRYCKGVTGFASIVAAVSESCRTVVARQQHSLSLPLGWEEKQSRHHHHRASRGSRCALWEPFLAMLRSHAGFSSTSHICQIHIWSYFILFHLGSIQHPICIVWRGRQRRFRCSICFWCVWRQNCDQKKGKLAWHNLFSGDLLSDRILFFFLFFSLHILLVVNASVLNVCTLSEAD